MPVFLAFNTRWSFFSRSMDPGRSAWGLLVRRFGVAPSVSGTDALIFLPFSLPLLTDIIVLLVRGDLASSSSSSSSSSTRPRPHFSDRPTLTFGLARVHLVITFADSPPLRTICSTFPVSMFHPHNFEFNDFDSFELRY